MEVLKELADLPEAQQKALWLILKLDKPAFRTSEIAKKMGGEVSGQSAGAVLGALYRNGYLEKVQGGRDKLWRLSNEVAEIKNEIRKQMAEVKQYWS
jgi:Mn-dependent DtxR family transcriptional regulator